MYNLLFILIYLYSQHVLMLKNKIKYEKNSPPKSAKIVYWNIILAR